MIVRRVIELEFALMKSPAKLVLSIIVFFYAATIPVCANLEKTDSVESDLERGMVAFQRKQFKKALTIFINQTKKEPKNVQALYYTALSLEHLGETNKAITFYKKVTELEPNSELGKLAATTLSKHLQGFSLPERPEEELKKKPFRDRIVVIPPKFDHPAVSSDAVNTIRHQVMRLPVHIYRMLDKAGTIIYIAPNATDKFPESVNGSKMVETKLPLSQENGRTYGQNIYIYEYATISDTKLGPKRLPGDLINNFMHEIGHALDNSLNHYSSDKEYTELLRMDVDTLNAETKEFLRIYTRATDVSASEEQAEVVAYLLGSRSKSALIIGSLFANTRNFVRRKLKL